MRAVVLGVRKGRRTRHEGVRLAEKRGQGHVPIAAVVTVPCGDNAAVARQGHGKKIVFACAKSGEYTPVAVELRVEGAVIQISNYRSVRRRTIHRGADEHDPPFRVDGK